MHVWRRGNSGNGEEREEIKSAQRRDVEFAEKDLRNIESVVTKAQA
jgi:hypothetical protein